VMHIACHSSCLDASSSFRALTGLTMSSGIQSRAECPLACCEVAQTTLVTDLGIRGTSLQYASSLRGAIMVMCDEAPGAFNLLSEPAEHL
jgi:hypothetical protein